MMMMMMMLMMMMATSTTITTTLTYLAEVMTTYFTVCDDGFACLISHIS
jgi:hypothetical protein